MNKKFDFKNCIILLLIVVIIIETIVGFTYINALKDKKNSVFYDADTTQEIDELRKLGKPVIVVFGADYCPMCLNYKPYVKECAELFENEAIIKYVDTVKHEAIRKEYNIELVPSTLFFDKDGQPYQPSNSLSITTYDEIIEERQYILDKFRIAEIDELDLNNQFEYGLTEDNELGYTKYVGILDILQLEEIIIDLIK